MSRKKPIQSDEAGRKEPTQSSESIQSSAPAEDVFLAFLDICSNCPESGCCLLARDNWSQPHDEESSE